MWLDWSLGVVVHVGLILGSWDLLKAPGGESWLRGDFPCKYPRGRPPAEKLLLVRIDGLTEEILMKAFERRRQDDEEWFLARKARVHGRVVGEEDVGWGVLGASTAAGSGAVWRPSPLDLRPPPPGSPPSIFKNAAVFGVSEAEAMSWNAPLVFTPRKKCKAWWRNWTEVDSWVFAAFDEAFLSAPLLGQMDLLEDKERLQKEFSDIVHNTPIYFLHFGGVKAAVEAEGADSSATFSSLDLVDSGLENLWRSFLEEKEAMVVVYTDGEPPSPLLGWGSGWSAEAEEGPAEVRTEEVAGLLATALGLPLPSSSTGAPPYRLLSLGAADRARAAACSAEQLSRLAASHRPAPGYCLALDPLHPREEAALISKIEEEMNAFKYENSINTSRKLADAAQRALHAYSSYEKTLAGPMLVACCFGWILALTVRLLKLYRDEESEGEDSPEDEKEKEKKSGSTWARMSGAVRSLHPFTIVVDAVSVAALILCGVAVHADRLPLRFHLYYVMVIGVWWRAIRELPTLISGPGWSWSGLAMSGGVYSFCVLVMAVFFHSRLVICLMIVLLFIWCMQDDRVPSSIGRAGDWMLSSVPLLLMPFLTSRRHQQFHPVAFFFCTLPWLVVPSCYAYKMKVKNWDLLYLIICYVLIAGAISNVYVVQLAETEPPTANTVIAWDLLVLSPILPLLGSGKVGTRLVQVGASLTVGFVLVSGGHEALCLLLLGVHLLYWLSWERPGSLLASVEPARAPPPSRASPSDLRRSALFFSYALLGYLGSGLPDSLVDTEHAWGRCFPRVPPLPAVALKAAHPLLLTTAVFASFLRLAPASVEAALLSALYYFSFLPLVSLVSFLAAARLSSCTLHLSHYIVGNAFPLLFLLFLPLAFLVTGPSLVQKYQYRSSGSNENRERTHSIDDFFK